MDFGICMRVKRILEFGFYYDYDMGTIHAANDNEKTH